MKEFACRECGAKVPSKAERCAECGCLAPFACITCGRTLSSVSLGVQNKERFPYGAFSREGEPLCHEHRLTRCHECEHCFALTEMTRVEVGKRADTYLRFGRPPRIEAVYGMFCPGCVPAEFRAKAEAARAQMADGQRIGSTLPAVTKGTWKTEPPGPGAWAAPPSPAAPLAVARAASPETPTRPPEPAETPAPAAPGLEIKHKGTGEVLLRVEASTLDGLDLRGAHLRKANLRYKSLQGADLSEANLYGASLRHANLTGAKLRGADLRKATLTGCRLADADLSGILYDEETRWPEGFTPPVREGASTDDAGASADSGRPWWRSWGRP